MEGTYIILWDGYDLVTHPFNKTIDFTEESDIVFCGIFREQSKHLETVFDMLPEGESICCLNRKRIKAFLTEEGLWN